MTLIHIDTNRYIDFYRAADTAIAVLDELGTVKNRLVFTEQTVVEFRRNRVGVIKRVLGEFKNSVDIRHPHASALLLSIKGHSDLKQKVVEYRALALEVAIELQRLMYSEEDDPVAQRLLALVRGGTAIMLPLTEEAIAAAQRRKLLGNPPCSPDKYTIGDEVIWELLLANIKDDLVIVTRDGTFAENRSLLQEEFHTRTGGGLRITDKISEALKIVGKEPTAELIQAEETEEQVREVLASPVCQCPEGPTPSGWELNGRFMIVRCKRCGNILSAFENDDDD